MMKPHTLTTLLLLSLLPLSGCGCDVDAAEGEGEGAAEGEGEGAAEGEGEGATEGEGEGAAEGEGEGAAEGEGEGAAEGEGEGAAEGEGEGESAAAPEMTSLSLANRGASTQVCQGDEVEVTVQGNHLTDVSAVIAGDFTVSSLNIVSDTELTFTLQVPHGTNLGSVAVMVTTDNASDTLADALTVTAITVSPDGDDADAGTPDFPVRTVTEAAARAGNNDEVAIEPGTYNAASGEIWTSNNGGPTSTATNLTIRGTAPGVSLEGPGASEPFAAWKASAAVTVTAVAISGFATGIHSSSIDAVNLTDVDVSDCATGISVNHLVGDGVHATDNTTGITMVKGSLTNFELRGNDDGLTQNGAFSVSLTDGVVADQTGTGISIGGGGTYTIDFVAFTDNGGIGARIDGGDVTFTNSTCTGNTMGLSGFDATTLDIADSAFVDNGTGVNLNDFGNDGAITMVNSSVTNTLGGVRYGITANVDSLDVEATTMTGLFQGIGVTRANRVDLTPGEQGPNTFFQISDVVIDDQRAARAAFTERNGSTCTARDDCNVGEECVPGGVCATVPDGAIIEMSGSFIGNDGGDDALTCNVAAVGDPLLASPVARIASDNICVRF